MVSRFERFPAVTDIISGTKFLAGLPSFLRRLVSTSEARSVLRGRLENRESDFLHLAAKGIYENPASPYRPLLQWAGCEYGDLENLVRRKGLEPALQFLFQNGVYLSAPEYKGRVPALRAGSSVEVTPEALSNPLSQSHLRLQTSGSSGRGMVVPVDVAFIRERCVEHRLLMESRGGRDWHFGVWGVPGNTDLVRILELHGSGARRIRWFSQVPADATGLHARYRWSIRLMRWAAGWAGCRLPRPEYVPLSDPTPIVRWLRMVLDSGGIPHLTTWVSSAIRLCQAAASLGTDIAHTQFTVGGEPLTEARLNMICHSGAVAVPRFMSVECGYIGYGCLRPDAPDDCHSLNDFTAVIQAGPEAAGRGLPAEALLLTSLRPTSPFILLNVSLGDQAHLERRSCGCPLENLGWSLHFRQIRSFEKLTSGGMTFLDSDIVRVLEKDLPSRLGGTPLDYQLIEEQTDKGYPQLLLVISPEVGRLDEAKVLEYFYESLGRGSGAERVMSLQWRSGGFITVKRQKPRTTSTGKILHLLKTSK
jgi:hypothetical protein